MKRITIALISFFAFAGFTAPIAPLQAFTPGEYSGAGVWLGDDGSSGDSSSFLELRENGWTSVQYRNGAQHIYVSAVNVDANGFFSAVVTDASDLDNIVVYNGNGNCGTSQCQMTVNLNNGVLQKSVHFDNANNLIYCYGAIYYNDGTPNVQWESVSRRLP